MARIRDAKGIFPQERDRILLRELAESFRILTPEQIAELVPRGSLRRVNFRLKQLRDAGYLSYRPLLIGSGRQVRGRQVGYYLGPRAGELFDSLEQKSVATIRTRAAQLADSGLTHRILVDSMHIRFRTASRVYPHFKLSTWVDQYSDWWQELQKYGVPIQADAYVECRILFGVENLLTAFLEVDWGTERGQTIEDKLERYAMYAASGDYERQFAAGKFRVLFVATSTSRMEQLAKKMERQGGNFFWITTWGEFKSSRLLDAYWRRPGLEGRYSLTSTYEQTLQ